MIVNCGFNNVKCNDISAVEECIKEMFLKESAEIWVSETGSSDENPCVGILIEKEKVSLTFFDKDGSCFAAVGDKKIEGVVNFCDGQYEIAGYQIIDKERAMNALLDFFEYKSRSDLIDWDQLY